MTVADELSRRVKLWEQISAGDATNAEASTLRSMRVYGGAQGIWVDKATTGTLSPDGQGITVSILHTGRKPEQAPSVPAINYRITDETELGKGAESVKFKDNLAAIQVLKQVETENRRPTPQEQRVLARYVGWGGLANSFRDPATDEFKLDWKERGEQLEAFSTRTKSSPRYACGSLIALPSKFPNCSFSAPCKLNRPPHIKIASLTI
jgi:hypothetical protein